MKVAVVGSRGFDNYELMCDVLDKYTITEIISGGARGADSLARRYATDAEIKITEFLPDWSKGRRAGIDRNTDIVAAADIIIAFWDGKSSGTYDTIKKARAANKVVHIVAF